MKQRKVYLQLEDPKPEWFLRPPWMENKPRELLHLDRGSFWSGCGRNEEGMWCCNFCGKEAPEMYQDLADLAQCRNIKSGLHHE